MDSEEDDPIEAFFKGKIVKATKRVQPSFNIQIRTDAKKEEGIKYERKVEENFTSKGSEERKLLTEFLNAPVEEIDDTLGIEEQDETEDIIKKQENLDIFKKYAFGLPKQNLPIESKHDLILQAIRNSKITIIKGDTGSGKSSQIPQYILEDCCQRNVPCNIIVTQPKKISAQSLASRVALERKCELGSLVGYQIGLEKNMDPIDTKILYCTTGVFLHKLIFYKSLHKWTHIIVDEIHERDLDMDMVLLIIRRLMVATKSKAKIILMSATLNSEKITQYFTLVQTPSVINLEVKKPFPTKIHYLDELEHLGASKDFISLNEPGISHSMFRLGVDIIDFFAQKGADSFLVFLPGIFEIQSFYEALEKKQNTFNINDYHVFILHSTVPLDNVRKLYDSSLKNKIILATNIAESSITIPNIRIIIDYCLTKYLEVDSASSLTQLKLSWAAKMNLEQRAGRTGRTSKGQIVRMLYNEQYQQLPSESKAEMQRTSLANVILRIKSLKMGRPSDILAISLDPPKRSAIIDAILILKENCALTRFSKKAAEFDFLDGNVTFTGAVMSKLPMDIRLSKLVVLGHVFSVLSECIIIAACLSIGTIFQHEISMNAFEAKLNFDSTSDLIAMLNAYNKYDEFHQFHKANKSESRAIEENWCRNKLLNYKNVLEIRKLIDDIKNRLKEFSFLKDDFPYKPEDKLCIIKICIAGAFYPNFYTFGGEIPGRDDFKMTFNKDLCSSVYFQTRKATQNGHLYEQQIQELLFNNEIINGWDDASVNFGTGSQKIFVQFNNLRNDCKIKVPGNVKLEVYKALKFNSFKKEKDVKIYLMSPENEEAYSSTVERNMLYNECVSTELKLKAKFNIYPDLSLKTEEKAQFFMGKITHIISPSKFYFQPKKAIACKEKMIKVMGSNLQPVNDIDEKIENNKIIVRHHNEFKRGQILEFPDNYEELFKVLLIDYGEVIECSIEDFYTGQAINRNKRQDIIREFFKISPLCYECKLAEIRPTATQHCGWSENAIDSFKAFVRDKIIQLDLYAFNVYDKVASVYVFSRSNPAAPFIKVNDKLVNVGLAEYSNESYIAMISQTLNNNSMKYEIHRESECIDFPKKLLKIPCPLIGPFSPLKSNFLTNITRAKESSDLIIDSTSVNSVLVDPYPYDGIKKMFVSSTKSMTNRGAVTLRQTTIMPFFKGVCSIVSLIFAPYAEIRHDNKKNRVTSILTGLGCDFTCKPYYAEHDCLLRTDVELHNEDLLWINNLRENISAMMQQKLLENFEFQLNPLNILRNIRHNSCSILLDIIHKERLQLGEKYTDGFDWTEFTKKEPSEYHKMFPKLNAPKLYVLPRESVKQMIHHLKDLEQKGRFNTRDEEIDCFACDEAIETLTDLKNHLLKIKHIKIKERYEFLDRS